MIDRKTAVLISICFEVIGVVIFAIYLGGWLDTRYGLSGKGTGGAIILGFIGWFLHLILVLRQLERERSDK